MEARVILNPKEWKEIIFSPIISFYCHESVEGVLPEPKPAAKFIPKWYKKIGTHTNEGRDSFGDKPMTVKKCMPVLDVMSYGFIIPLAADTHVLSNGDLSIIQAPAQRSIHTAEFHHNSQLGGKDSPTYPASAIKFINHWVIKTRPGWSTLFTAPFNHMNPHFTCMSGLVDTDKYPKEVNFPAIWHTPNFDDCIPAGTPLVQVIPVKRGTFNNDFANVRKMTKKEFEEIDRIRKCQDSRKGYYTNELREKK